MGRRNNQNFVNLPHSKLIEQLIYKKVREYGIEVSLVSESYTSKASALDFDDIPDYEKGVKKTFSGKRIKRGLYLTKQGVQINADTNSAINIGRNELGDEWLKKKLLGLDEGVFVNTPTVFPNSLWREKIVRSRSTLRRSRELQSAVVHYFF